MLFVFAFLVAVPLALNVWASRSDFPRYVDAVILSSVLCVVWGFTTAMASVAPFPVSKQYHPLLDLSALAICIAAYMTNRQKWKLVLALLFMGQLAAHAWFWSTHKGLIPAPAQLGRTYILALNLLWFCQLFCVGSVGGAHVARRVVDRLRRDRRLPDLARR